jgi:hypothetical protein
MKINTFTIIAVVAIVLAFAGGIFLSRSTKKEEKVQVKEVEKVVYVSPKYEARTFASIPTGAFISGIPVPTSNPNSKYPLTIFEKTDEKISFTQPGNQKISIWEKRIKLNVFKMENGTPIPATWDDIKIGQQVKIALIKPGEEGSLYIGE